MVTLKINNKSHTVDASPDMPLLWVLRGHDLVEIKRVKELPLSTLSLPHHGLLPRITV
jgi:hypothetical protein